VDLKADRQSRALRVQAAWAEPDVDAGLVAEQLAGQLRDLASWLGLERVVLTGRGDLSRKLAGNLR
jgi:uncharacterized protein YcaQ